MGSNLKSGRICVVWIASCSFIGSCVKMICFPSTVYSADERVMYDAQELIPFYDVVSFDMVQPGNVSDRF